MHAEWDGTYGRRVTTAVGDGEFLNPATVIDCFSRRLAGWSIADHMRTSLVTDALRAAAAPRGSLAGAVFHSDHGAQGEFTDVCAELGVRRSMGAVGMSADNALAESFNGALKRETLRGARRFDEPALPSGGLPLDHALQHPPSALGERTPGTNRLRTAVSCP